MVVVCVLNDWNYLFVVEVVELMICFVGDVSGMFDDNLLVFLELVCVFLQMMKLFFLFLVEVYDVFLFVGVLGFLFCYGRLDGGRELFDFCVIV